MDEQQLSPAEQAALDYHRTNLALGQGMKNADGSMTTFKGAVVGVDRNRHMILPTYWHGQVRSIPEAMRFAIRSGIPFPTYGSAEEALQAEQRIHKIMEQDMIDYMSRQPKQTGGQ
jgi:hypothetical protein